MIYWESRTFERVSTSGNRTRAQNLHSDLEYDALTNMPPQPLDWSSKLWSIHVPRSSNCNGFMVAHFFNDKCGCTYLYSWLRNPAYLLLVCSPSWYSWAFPKFVNWPQPWGQTDSGLGSCGPHGRLGFLSPWRKRIWTNLSVDGAWVEDDLVTSMSSKDGSRTRNPGQLPLFMSLVNVFLHFPDENSHYLKYDLWNCGENMLINIKSFCPNNGGTEQN